MEADRRRVTVLTYGALGCYAYCLYALGPILALLRRDLHLSYTTTSLHSSLWACGTIVTGFTYDRLARRLGRRALLWAAAVVSAAGALMFVGGYAVAVTLAAAAVLGLAGTLLQTGTVAVLADAFAHRADAAFVGANVLASATAVAAPLVLGGLDGTPVGWRVGMVLPVAALAVLWFSYGADRLPQAAAPAGDHRRPLPRAYWVAAALVAVGVGIEFCIVFHGANLLRDHVGLSTRDAATAMSLFFVAELVGRVVGRGMTRTPGRAVPLTVGALAVTAFGFSALWLSRAPAVALTGLTVAGLGVANLYPLTLALAVRAAPGRTDSAAARVQVPVGAAVLVAPLALGALADHVGVVRAYAVEPVLLVLAAGLLVAAGRVRKA